MSIKQVIKRKTKSGEFKDINPVISSSRNDEAKNEGSESSVKENEIKNEIKNEVLNKVKQENEQKPLTQEQIIKSLTAKIKRVENQLLKYNAKLTTLKKSLEETKNNNKENER